MYDIGEAQYRGDLVMAGLKIFYFTHGILKYLHDYTITQIYKYTNTQTQIFKYRGVLVMAGLKIFNYSSPWNIQIPSQIWYNQTDFSFCNNI